MSKRQREFGLCSWTVACWAYSSLPSTRPYWSRDKSRRWNASDFDCRRGLLPRCPGAVIVRCRRLSPWHFVGFVPRPKEITMDKDAVLHTLNRIMELELAGVVRYTHYALMVYGYNCIPIVEWLQKNADEGLIHARLAGELVTWLGGHPSLAIGPLLESHKHDIGDILRESLEHERESLDAYYSL